MECERLQRLVKNWYAQVQDETMAPGRMVSFMETHLAECQVCLADPKVRQEVDKITAIIMPPAKVRQPSGGAAEDEAPAGDEAEKDRESSEDEDIDDDI